MQRIDFTTLRLFVAVAGARSLTGAARQEHMALAAVSKRISDLERRLGTSLLYRRPRGVDLTPAGDALLHHARHMLDSMASLQADLSEYSDGVRGHVRIHANTSAIIEFLPADLSAFTRRYPEVKIDLEERVSRDVLHAVRDGLTDIGIFAGRPPKDDLCCFDYRQDRLVLVAPPGHASQAQSSVSLAEVIDEDFIGLQQDASLHALMAEAAERAGRTLRLRIQVRSFEGICRMIGHGMGIGILPERAVTHPPDGTRLCVVPLADAWARRQLSLAVRDYDALPVLARLMVDHLRETPTPA